MPFLHHSSQHAYRFPGYALVALVGVLIFSAGSVEASTKKEPTQKIALANVSSVQGNAKRATVKLKRYPKPAFYGKNLKKYNYKKLVIVGADAIEKSAPANDVFFYKIKQAIDLIHAKSPDIFALMQNINRKGSRIIYYTGRIGPASFASWKNDFVVNITASNIDEDPVFENNVYSLAATLIHELVGHGRQQADGRVWAMYDWCGKDSKFVKGVVRQINHKGASSGFVEYEANLFAKWFLESVRGTYPDFNEPAIRRYVKLVRVIKKRFPGWYDDRKPARVLLVDFKNRFNEVCPGTKFTPHPVSPR